MQRGLGDPDDRGGVEAVEDGGVLGARDPLRGLVEAVEVGVGGATVGVA